jgi:hypothetical protein
LDKPFREIGVKGEYKLWYVSPRAQLKDGLRLLKNDKHTIRFINEFKGEATTNFYVEIISVNGFDKMYDIDVEEVVEVVDSDEVQYKTNS